MAKKNNGKDFLFSDDCGFINGDDEGGESYRYSDGSGYYHGADGSEGYIYSDLTFILLGTNMDLAEKKNDVIKMDADRKQPTADKKKEAVI
mgnify:FL=1